MTGRSGLLAGWDTTENWELSCEDLLATWDDSVGQSPHRDLCYYLVQTEPQRSTLPPPPPADYRNVDVTSLFMVRTGLSNSVLTGFMRWSPGVLVTTVPSAPSHWPEITRWSWSDCALHLRLSSNNDCLRRAGECCSCLQQIMSRYCPAWSSLQMTKFTPGKRV